MGQKTNPISNRIGITRGWDSNWVGGNYAEKIAEDYEIRKYLGSRLAKASLSRIIVAIVSEKNRQRRPLRHNYGTENQSDQQPSGYHPWLGLQLVW